MTELNIHLLYVLVNYPDPGLSTEVLCTIAVLKCLHISSFLYGVAHLPLYLIHHLYSGFPF